MKLSLPIVLVFAASASAQLMPTLYQPLGQVKEFLQLSDSQVQSILTNNNEYSRWFFGKQSRIQQVQTEIAQETARPNLDSMALGVRYTEVELICRDIRQQIPVYRKKNTDVLTDSQKAKLKVLDDAVKLAPVIAEAQNGNLMGGGSSYSTGFFGISTASFGAIYDPAGGCYSSFPGIVIRNGDFSSLLTIGGRTPAAPIVIVNP